ncbi:YfjI family protein [Novipirellula rosea]|uniref:YfjI family protein n=1 Tax=Novipirellula rosea TaxID=1031540 RepID=UPI0031ED4CC3
MSSESEATQTPPDMATLLALTATSVVLAKKVLVEPWAGYREPVNIYSATLLDPANRKSAVFADAKRPIELIEQELHDAALQSVAERQSERRQDQLRLNKLEKKTADEKDPEKRVAASEEASTLAKKLATTPEPVMPTLVVEDTTTEKLALLMHENGERLAVLSAEGGIFAAMGGRYSAKGGADDFEMYLKAHAGDSSKVHRISRSPVVLESPALTIGLAIQPEVIRGLAGKSAFRGRGLLGRFIYAYPESWIGKRKIRTVPMPKALELEYQSLIKRLFQIQPRPDGSPNIVRLNDEAANEFEEYCRWIEDELGAGELEMMRDWGGKLAGLTLRIAGLMHCVKHANSDPLSNSIDVETMRNAQHIAKWAIPHAAATFELLSCDIVPECVGDAVHVIRSLTKDSAQIPSTVTRRNIQRHGQSRFNNDATRLDNVLSLLEQANYLRRRSSAEKGGKVTYDVSPRFRAESSNVPIASLSPLSPDSGISRQERSTFKI